MEIQLTDREGNNSVSQRSVEKNGSGGPATRFIEEKVDEPNEFEMILQHKFSIFKSMIMQRVLDRNPALKFTKEEAKRILKYA